MSRDGSSQMVLQRSVIASTLEAVPGNGRRGDEVYPERYGRRLDSCLSLGVSEFDDLNHSVVSR